MIISSIEEYVGKIINVLYMLAFSVYRQKRPTPVSTAPGPAPLPEPEALQAIRKGERKRREKVCIVASPEDSASDEADECVIPIFNEFADAEFPGFVKPCFVETVRQARVRFVKTPGLTKLACHQIDTVGSPARVPPRGMPAHFQQEAQEQMNDMRKKGIIVESSSSWLAPAVYTRKKTDCVWTTAKQTQEDKKERLPTSPD